MITDKEKVEHRIKSDYEYLVAQGYEVLGVFLQGSQNYNLDTYESDIDTKAIVIPTIEDVAHNKAESKTHVLENGEHLDIKDIRLMHTCILKQNINFVEILFTDYKYINPIYENVYSVMFENAENIAHYDGYASVQCMYGMIRRYEGLICKDGQPGVEKYGYNPKALYHILHMSKFMEDYLSGKSYKECLNTNGAVRTHLIDVKTHSNTGNYGANEAVDIVKKAVKQAEVCIAKHYSLNETHKKVDEYKNIVDKCTVDILKHFYKNSI